MPDESREKSRPIKTRNIGYYRYRYDNGSEPGDKDSEGKPITDTPEHIIRSYNSFIDCELTVFVPLPESHGKILGGFPP
jgi:hypothetical protein